MAETTSSSTGGSVVTGPDSARRRVQRRPASWLGARSVGSSPEDATTRPPRISAAKAVGWRRVASSVAAARFLAPACSASARAVSPSARHRVDSDRATARAVVSMFTDAASRACLGTFTPTATSTAIAGSTRTTTSVIASRDRTDVMNSPPISHLPWHRDTDATAA